MKIIKTKNFKDMSNFASELISKKILEKPGISLGLATGYTQLGLYKSLVSKYKKGEFNFSRVKTFNLDEYYPIKKSSKKSFHHYMHKNLFNHVNIKKTNINLLNGETKDPKKECERYENKIKKNPIQIQILGLGVNGHVGFNEPGSSFYSKTRLVDLDPITIEDKKSPERALTMGVRTIFKAKKIILLASGKKKAKTVKRVIRGKINETCPASFMRKHKDFTVIVDKAASSLL